MCFWRCLPHVREQFVSVWTRRWTLSADVSHCETHLNLLFMLNAWKNKVTAMAVHWITLTIGSIDSMCSTMNCNTRGFPPEKTNINKKWFKACINTSNHLGFNVCWSGTSADKLWGPGKINTLCVCVCVCICNSVCVFVVYTRLSKCSALIGNLVSLCASENRLKYLLSFSFFLFLVSGYVRFFPLALMPLVLLVLMQ